MATSKKFSELPVASSMNNGDLFAVAQEDAQAETGYTSKSATALVVGKKLNGEIEYATDLPSFPSGYQNPLDALELLKQEILDLYPVDSASGSIANFTTSLALPLVALKTNIVAQGGGGTPSAPVAITGFSSIELTCADEDMQTADTFTIQLGQTVYGGFVDWENGSGQKTYCEKFDMSTLSWTYNSGSGGYFSASTPVDNRKAYGVTNVICDIYKTSNSASVSNMEDLSIKGASNSNSLYVKDSNYTDATLFAQSLQGKYITYEMATPTTFSVTTTMPSTIEGEQNWFADSGDIELEYKMGVQEYIDKKIAEVQALVL